MARERVGFSRNATRLLWALPIVMVLSVIPLWWFSESAYWYVVGEDSLAEWATFLVYVLVAMLSAALGGRLARTGLRLEAAMFVLLALGALFVAGEEVSWFQRQIGFAGPPELVDRNLQGEANLHNLLGRAPLHGAYILVGLFGSVLARRIVPRIPRLRDRPWLFVPPRALAAWFGVAWVYYFWADYVNFVLRGVFGDVVDVQTLTGSKLQEIVELALAGGFLIFVYLLLRSDDPARRAPDTSDSDGLASGGRAPRLSSERRYDDADN